MADARRDRDGLRDESGRHGNGVLIEPLAASEGGPVNDASARAALRTLERQVIEDRMTINAGHFFDAWGRGLRIEEAQPQ